MTERAVNLEGVSGDDGNNANGSDDRLFIASTLRSTASEPPFLRGGGRRGGGSGNGLAAAPRVSEASPHTLTESERVSAEAPSDNQRGAVPSVLASPVARPKPTFGGDDDVFEYGSSSSNERERGVTRSPSPGVQILDLDATHSEEQQIQHNDNSSGTFTASLSGNLALPIARDVRERHAWLDAPVQLSNDPDRDPPPRSFAELMGLRGSNKKLPSSQSISTQFSAASNTKTSLVVKTNPRNQPRSHRENKHEFARSGTCLLYTSPSPRDRG